eukprot:9164035-Pyramimonas_sp.AAC.1
MEPAPVVNQWGACKNLQAAGFECMCVGQRRFTATGCREIVCCSCDHAYNARKALKQAAGDEVETFSDEFTVVHLVE